ncbi:hypothetical protein NCS56_00487000 [Fusarium sp. Ph1]|nr:hypothetical protein NCS56_00487000 [Fusarium sp. Ph1]
MGKQTSNPAASQDIKKLRNRLSQQAFRRRRADLLRDLRERADHNHSNESEALAKARADNAALREQLAEAHAKLNGLLASVQGLVQCTAPNPKPAKPGVEESAQGDSLSDNSVAEQPIADDAVTLADLLPTSQPLAQDNYMVQRSTEQGSSQEASLPIPYFGALTTLGMTQQIPNIWSFEYQMGPDVYHDALLSSETLSHSRGQLWIESNSPFSDHINFIQRELASKTEAPNSQLSTPLLYLATTSALSMFHTVARQDVMRWYAKTRFYHTRDVTVWKIRPCDETFNRLHPQYQPTLLQLQCSHAAVIDWVPFPSIRDTLIRYHAANPCIDQVVSDIVGVYVVETLLNELIADSPPLQVYIRVVDLVQAMAGADEDPSQEPASLPVSEISDIFTSPSVALAVARHLQIEYGLSRYKLDPGLFNKHPEFYESAGLLMAQGAPLKPDSTSLLSFPGSLDKNTASLYRNFIAFTCSNMYESLRA